MKVFECKLCGDCCHGKGGISINEAEMEKIASFINIEKESFALEYTYTSNGRVSIRSGEDGYCVFYDAENKRCKVRAHRPLGCRIYPVIYDEDKGIIVDHICPSRGSVTEKQKAKRGEKVLKLLKTIDAEAKRRRLAEPTPKRS